MFENATRVLDSGETAQIVADDLVQGAAILFIADTPQSHVNIADPTNTFFEYVRRMAAAIDAAFTPGMAISALHLGGGAYTLPRYIEATRPGSNQQVIEIDSNLVDFVREHLPLPKRAKIRVRRGDARLRLKTLPPGMLAKIDTIVIDIFSGATTPAHLTTLEFYEELKPFLHEESVVLVNVADGPGGKFVRSQIATLRSTFKNVALAAEPGSINGKRFGNIVLIASNHKTVQSGPWLTVMQNLRSRGPHPVTVLEGQELTSFVASAEPVKDSAAKDSPKPPPEIFKR